MYNKHQRCLYEQVSDVVCCLSVYNLYVYMSKHAISALNPSRTNWHNGDPHILIKLIKVLPYSRFHLAVIQLMVVHLSKKREEHLDSTDGVDGTVDGVSHCGFYILWGGI